MGRAGTRQEMVEDRCVCARNTYRSEVYERLPCKKKVLLVKGVCAKAKVCKNWVCVCVSVCLCVCDRVVRESGPDTGGYKQKCQHTQLGTERWPQAHKGPSSRIPGQPGDRQDCVDLLGRRATAKTCATGNR